MSSFFVSALTLWCQRGAIKFCKTLKIRVAPFERVKVEGATVSRTAINTWHRVGT